MVEAYPLHWPAGYPRAPKRKDSRFKNTLAGARDFVKGEVKRLNGTGLVISTNLPVRNDGELYADVARYRIDDPGVAVYFTRDKQQVCLCCDTYTRVWENLQAIGRTIEALRQIDRDGVSDFLNRAFSGFKALPERASGKNCWDVLGISQTKDLNAINQRYRELVKAAHPQNGGSQEQLDEVLEARNQALQYANQ